MRLVLAALARVWPVRVKVQVQVQVQAVAVAVAVAVLVQRRVVLAGVAALLAVWALLHAVLPPKVRPPR